jgi:hypothetical protein
VLLLHLSKIFLKFGHIFFLPLFGISLLLLLLPSSPEEHESFGGRPAIQVFE